MFLFLFLLAAAPQPAGPRPKGTESSGTLHTALCNPDQPASQPSPILCTGLRSPPGRRYSIEYSKSTALRSIEPASRGPGDRCCPRRRSEGVSQQLQDLKRPRNRQQFQWPSQTAAKSVSIFVKSISPARFRNGLVTGNGEPVRHRLTENSESIQTRFQLLQKPAP